MTLTSRRSAAFDSTQHGPVTEATHAGGRALVALVAHARAVPSAARESFGRALEELQVAEGLVVVHTCHRVDAYFVPGSFDERLLPALPAGGLRLQDVEAARHLITVACGLDSAVIGEDQILHQLRVAYADRRGDGRRLDPVLDRLFQAALHAGRVAHSWFEGGTRSLSDVAIDRIEADAGDLDSRAVLIVGAGKMGRLAALAASRRGAAVLVSNRTHPRAVALAREVHGGTVPFGWEAPPGGPIAGAVVALGGDWALEKDGGELLLALRPLVVDLSTPPAVPEWLREGLGDRFVSVDDLAHGAPLDPPERLRRKLEVLVSDTGREYCRWLRMRDAVPAIQALATAAEAQRTAELEWLLGRLPMMSEADRLIVEQMTHRLVAGLLHGPIAALNSDESGRLERAARDLFRI